MLPSPLPAEISMSQKLRIVVSAVPGGPWSLLADRLEAKGADVVRVPLGADEIDLPTGWVPDGLVTTPAEHQKARFDQIDLDLWDQAAELELNGRFRIGQAVARRMLAGNGGSIVHLVAAEGLPGVAEAGSAATLGYASAGLSRGIALDLKDKVRSNTIAVEADLDAVAALVLFLCGLGGQGVTGQIASIGPELLQLFGQSRPQRIVHRDGGWDEASLEEQVRRWAAFLPRLTGETAQ